jgi:hypothetical protein
MAIEKDNPLNEEEVDVEQEAVVSFPEEETESKQKTIKIFLQTLQKTLMNELYNN